MDDVAADKPNLSTLERITRLETQFEASQNALFQASTELARRLDELNHLRVESMNERGRFVTMEKWENRHQELEDKISDLVLWRARVMGISIGAGACGGIITFLLEQMLKRL